MNHHQHCSNKDTDTATTLCGWCERPHTCINLDDMCSIQCRDAMEKFYESWQVQELYSPMVKPQ